MGIPGLSAGGDLGFDGGDSGDVTSNLGAAGIAGDFVFNKKPTDAERWPL